MIGMINNLVNRVVDTVSPYVVEAKPVKARKAVRKSVRKTAKRAAKKCKGKCRSRCRKKKCK